MFVWALVMVDAVTVVRAVHPANELGERLRTGLVNDAVVRAVHPENEFCERLRTGLVIVTF